ncbi:MAG: hypothetical protein AAFP17_04995 [Pseudomonadota bacterium]
MHTPIGALPVGTMETLPALEAGAVRALRLWFSGPEAQAALWNAFAKTFGAQEGHRHLGAFERFLAGVLEVSHRPLMRHAMGCRCLGADEHAFAGLLAAAARGRREDALLLALALTPPHRALALVAEAEAVGPVLGRLAPLLAACCATAEEPRAAPDPDAAPARERVLH